MSLFTYKQILFILACQLLLTAIFFAGYAHLSLRLDESQSLWQTSHSLPILLNSLSQNVHVPLYHTTVHYWQIAFGNDVLTGRILSLVFMLAVLPIAFSQFKKIYNTSTAYLFVALLSLSPFIHWFASEIRMYTMLLLVTIVSQTTFIRLMRAPTRERFFFLTIISVIGVYTHYFFFLVLFGQLLFYLSHFRYPFTTVHRKGFFITGLVTIVSFLPWIYATTRTPGSSSDPDLVAPTSIDFFNVFSNFLFGFQTDPVNSLILSFWPLLFILLAVSIRPNSKLLPETHYFIIGALTPLIAALIASYIIAPLFLSRYLIVALPSIFILLTRSLLTFHPVLRTKIIIALFMTLIIASLVQFTSPNTPVKEEFSSVTEAVNQMVTERDIVFLTAPFIIYPILYYYEGDARIEHLPYWNRFNGEQLTDQLTEGDIATTIHRETLHKEKMYVVFGYDQGYETMIKTYLETHYEKIDEYTFGTQLVLHVYNL